MPSVVVKGRGSSGNPTNRFEEIGCQLDPGEQADRVPTIYYRDQSRSIISKNDSPDIPFENGINPYRGCSHGCFYCYARPYHEYLGLSSGLDFETRIFVKEDAPALLEAEFMKPRYEPAPIVMSGVTDPYQPIEQKLELTRRLLEVFVRFRNPVSMITKSALIERDADLLADLAQDGAAAATISITTLDAGLQRRMEPQASSPRDRLRAVRTLSDAGIPVGVNVAPVIPGLTDQEIPAILQAAADAGARRAIWIMVRLPYALKELTESWLESHVPLKKEKVLHTITQMRGGKLYDSNWGTRMSGTGPRADQISRLFDIHRKRVGLTGDQFELSVAAFRRIRSTNQQGELW